jgi:hypothetical protein
MDPMTLRQASKRLFRISVRRSWMLRGLDVSPMKIWQRDGLLFSLAACCIYTPRLLARAVSDQDLIDVIRWAIWLSEAYPLPRDEFGRRADEMLRTFRAMGVL